MRQVAVLVEGRTEECLVEDVLGPVAEKRGLYLVPIVVWPELNKMVFWGGFCGVPG